MARVGGNYSEYHMSAKEIGEELGISKQRVCQIIDRALKKLRENYKNLKEFENEK